MTTLTGYSDARPLRTEDALRPRGRAATIALWCVHDVVDAVAVGSTRVGGRAWLPSAA